MIKPLTLNSAIGAIGAILFFSQTALAEDVARMKAGTCLGCHGVPSYTNVYPSFHVPKLAGQHAEYLQAALRAYRSGERSHPTMRANAVHLSDADIKMLAEYFAAQPAADRKDAKKVAANHPQLPTCAACHTDTGNSITPINPTIAGQYRSYLLHALKSYKNGERKNPIMMGIVSALSEEDMEQLAIYYSKQVGLGTINTPETAYSE